MKRIFLWLAVVVSACPLRGQDAAMQVGSGANIISKSGAYIVLSNVHLVNNGNIQQLSGDGTLKFTGGNDVNMGGTGTVLDRLMLSKDGSSKLTLTSNVGIISQINFQGGLLNLGNYKADLGITGKLINESELSRAYTKGTGYLEATGNLLAPSSANLGNLGAIITSPENMGNTVIRRGHKIQSGISVSSGTIERYFDIIPLNNNALKATLRIQYFDTELNGISEATLNQWKSKDNITWSSFGFSTRDATENFVEKRSIGSFMRWTLAAITSPVITCPQNIAVNDPSGKCEMLVDLSGNNGATATGSPTPVITYKINGKTITSPYVFSKGTTTVAATATNGIDPSASCTFTVTVTCNNLNRSAITNITAKEIPKTDPLTARALPNPFSDNFILVIASGSDSPVRVRIMDALGRLMEERTNLPANGSLRIGGQKYRPGIYFTEVIQGNEKITMKLIKQTN